MPTTHTLPSDKIYKVTIVGHENLHDPERPSWANTPTVQLADHPPTYVGYLTSYFYGNSINRGEEIPSWTYNTLQSYADGQDANSLFDTDNWETTSLGMGSNALPPMDGPVPNTMGVYFGQDIVLQKFWTDEWLISDFDVLRFWPVGRPMTYGGLSAWSIGKHDLYHCHDLGHQETWMHIVDAMSVIEIGEAVNDDSNPYTYVWKDAWINGSRNGPKTWPSYVDLNRLNYEPCLYPPIPELGTWIQGGKPIGIKEWNWTSVEVGTTMYAHFTDWYQNGSLSYSPGSGANPKLSYLRLGHPSYGNHCSPTEEFTSRQWHSPEGGPYFSYANDGTATGLAVTTESGIYHGWPYHAREYPWGPNDLGGFDCPEAWDCEGDGYNWGEGVPYPVGWNDSEYNYYDSFDGATRKLLLADELWYGGLVGGAPAVYYTGGFEIENRGLAYHMRNAVKWNSLGQGEGVTEEPFIGNLVDGDLYDGYGSIMDGNYGPMPPLLNFSSAGGSWSSSLKDKAPYHNYGDWNVESGNLDQYYSSMSEYLKVSFDDYDEMSDVWVRKPDDLWIYDKYNERVCPEYTVGSKLLIQKISPVYIDGRKIEYMDTNAANRVVINYKNQGTLLPYYDYFPDTYIPFETSFLLPSGQHIPPYSFNCSTPTYSDQVRSDVIGGAENDGSKGNKGDEAIGQQGHKGPKGLSGSYPASRGITGSKGISGSQGDGGGVGGQGGAGMGGSAGDKGTKGPQGGGGAAGGKGPAGAGGDQGDDNTTQGPPGDPGYSEPGDEGDAGVNLISGNYGAVNSEKHNYTVAGNMWMDIKLGDAAFNAGNEATTIRFTRRHFGVCLENDDAEPEYKSIYVYASDTID